MLCIKIIRDLFSPNYKIINVFHWIVENTLHPKVEGWLGITPLYVVIESLKAK